MGSQSPSHFLAAMCCTVPSARRAGSVKSCILGAEVSQSCHLILILHFRCCDVTDGFESSTTRGSVNSLFSMLPPCVFRAFRIWPSPGGISLAHLMWYSNLAPQCVSVYVTT